MTMKTTCLSVCKQGWFGVPLFFFGIASLAFSQLVLETETQSLPPDQQIQFIDAKLKQLSDRLIVIEKDQSGGTFSDSKRAALGDLNQLSSIYGNQDSRTVSIQSQINKAESGWNIRSEEIKQGIASVEGRISEASLIFEDLKQNFAGRLDEASPALLVLRENLMRTETEIDAISSISKSAISEVGNAFSNIKLESDSLASQAIPLAPNSSGTPKVFSAKSKQITDAIKAKQAIPLSINSPFAPAINTDAGFVQLSTENDKNNNSSEIINRLKTELAVSKSVQNELSADSSDLQGDLRKAYREIVSLQTSLKETQMLARELESTKNSLWQNEDGQRPTAQSVSGKINRMEKELMLAREDLRASRQTLLVEQERSNAMIRSVTNELERTRQDLEKARTASITSSSDSLKLATLERELNEARRSLQMAKMAPKNSTQENYLALQNELRKALGEITRMQVELSEKDALESQLEKLKSSMEELGDSPSRSVSPEYVNKLLIDLNAAKGEVVKAKSLNRSEMQNLIELVASLEDELKISKLELKKTKLQFNNSQEKIAQKEFEYATTIQRLEEDAQLTQDSLRDASLGKLPAIPFVDEMERNLADSEARIRTLSDRFEAEQSKATELIDGLQVELDAAVVRQKRAIDQLARRELDLEGKDLELNQAKEEAKKLKEELEVVKVIAGQLEDLNTVLEETKRTQNSQSGSLDQIVDSLREELNQAKVELVFANEDNERLKQDSAEMVSTLELQLENTRNQLLAEQENQADQTNESKELVLDLKYELDEARKEISKMKSAGMGESVETKQAVSQLQEALGTIRILQESLEESEKVNLQVDNLRTELANSMESQLLELQHSEDIQRALKKKADDLEAEIALLRNQGTGSGVEYRKTTAALTEELDVSKTRIIQLEKRAGMVEDNDVLSIINLEEELAAEKNRNQVLQQEISKNAATKNKTIELLESELSDAITKLQDAESKDQDLKSRIANLENEISKSNSLIADQSVQENSMDQNKIAMVTDLENQLLETQNRLSAIIKQTKESSSETVDPEVLVKLENELANAEEKIKSLQISLESEIELNSNLQDKLSLALDNQDSSSEFAEGDIQKTEDLTRLDIELLNAQKTIDELISKTQSEEKERVALMDKLSIALSKIDAMENDQSSNTIPSKQQDLEIEINELRSLLQVKDQKQRQLEEELEKTIVAMTEKKTEDFIRLDNELLDAQKTIDELIVKTQAEEKERVALKDELTIALSKIETIESDQIPNFNPTKQQDLELEINELKTLLKAKDQKQSELEEELEKAIVEMTEKEAELEIASSINEQMQLLSNKLELAEMKLSDAEKEKPIVKEEPRRSTISDQERTSLQNEIEQLKSELEIAKAETSPPNNNDDLLINLQNELQDAVAESVEMQTELEETKRRLALIESEGSALDRTERPELKKLLQDAETAENQAQIRISNLTDALRNSEELRKEMEFLLTEANDQESSDTTPNLANDPRFKSLQRELLLLQQDLLFARNIEDPRVQGLEAELALRQNDSSRLNDEFKTAMGDFSKLKEQVAVLEDENRRLQNSIPSQSIKLEADLEKQNLENRFSELSKENSNLRDTIEERDNRVSRLREDLVRAQMAAPGVQPDNSALRAQLVRLEGSVQIARDGEAKSKMNLQRSESQIQLLNQKLALLEDRLRESESQNRGIPSAIPNYPVSPVVVSNPSNAADSAEIIRLREQNQRLQSQLISSSAIPQRDELDRKIRDLNQKNLTAQIQLDQERSKVEDLRNQLAEARNIKQGVLERGQSSNIKVQLLNQELDNANSRISSLENALVAARGAIQILKNSKDSPSSTFKVSSPRNVQVANSQNFSGFSSNTSVPAPSRISRPYRSQIPPLGGVLPQSSVSPRMQNIPSGDASLQLKAQVQFLNNKNRPAGFTEFFVSRDNLETILRQSRIRIPISQGIDSPAELWARSIQRGYRYPGVSSAIRNALANSSLSRIKTNSIGEANIENIETGQYFIVGASTLGQVGVVWSKPIVLRPGSNQVSLDLRDAAWAE